ncbi:MAG: ATP-binding cassette domain-containing protein [Streptosporangiales bacterium]|nr:ATP-binding cassette domain-containing protein [Streptosporangiales bacterium]
MPAVETRDLTKRYGGVVAVDGVALRIEPGQIYGLVGLNGAGKSTLIRMLLGMTRPSRGMVTLFGGRVSSGRGPWRRVGYLVDGAHAYPGMTVDQNLEIARRLHGIADRRAVDRAVDLLDLGAYRHRRAGQLSLGNGQRLGLAKALLPRPDLLVLDEPGNGLDPAAVVALRELLRRCAGAGVAVLLSSHVLAEVARLATRVGIIDRGRLLTELDGSDLTRRARTHLLVDAVDRPAARRVLDAHGVRVVGDTPEGLVVVDDDAVEHPDRVASLLVDASVPPTALHVRREDLEGFFLRLLAEHGDRTGVGRAS